MKFKAPMFFIITLIVTAAFFAIGCSDKTKETSETAVNKPEMPAVSDTSLPTQQSKNVHKGKVVTTMNSGGYTYIQIEENGKKLWAASQQFKVSVGDRVEFPEGSPMTNFHSKTLNRTFELILFVPSVKVGDVSADLNQKALPKGHPPINMGIEKETAIKPGSIKKAGNTVSECYSMKDSLKGKNVQVRGKVVKFTGGVMGKNWIHLQDGSGKEGTNDIAVTTKDFVEVGKIIVVSGKISYNKDFGAGYKYPAIIEDASIKVE